MEITVHIHGEHTLSVVSVDLFHRILLQIANRLFFFFFPQIQSSPMPRRTHTAIYTNSRTYRGTNPSGLAACLLPLLRLIKHPFFMCRTQRNGCGPMYPCFHPAFFLFFPPSILSPSSPRRRQASLRQTLLGVHLLTC